MHAPLSNTEDCVATYPGRHSTLPRISESIPEEVQEKLLPGELGVSPSLLTFPQEWGSKGVENGTMEISLF